MAEPISIQQLKDASEDAITLADFIYKPANVMIPRRLAADINSLQYYLDYMSSYAQRSYETYDEMVANAVNLPNGVSAFVTNDLDTTKNGLYTYNGVSFVRGEYQPENAAKEFVESKLGGLQVVDGLLPDTLVNIGSGLTQKDFNFGVDSVVTLLALPNPTTGVVVNTASYLAGQKVGGNTYRYNSARAAENDGGSIINGWEVVGKTALTVWDFGYSRTDSEAAHAAFIKALKSKMPLQLLAETLDSHLELIWTDITTDKLIFGCGKNVSVIERLRLNPRTANFIARGFSINNNGLNYAMIVDSYVNLIVDDFSSTGNLDAVALHYAASNKSRAWVNNCYSENSSRVGFTVDLNAHNVVISNCYAYNCRQGFHSESGFNVKFIDCIADMCGNDAMPVIDYQPAEYAGGFRLHNYTDQELIRCKNINKNGTNYDQLGGGGTNLVIRDCVGINLHVNVSPTDVYTNIDIDGLIDGGLYVESRSAKLAGYLKVKNFKGGALECGSETADATRKLDYVEFINVDCARLQTNTFSDKGVLFMENVTITSNYRNSLDGFKHYILGDLIYNFLGTELSQYPNFGYSISSNIADSFTLRSFRSTGASGGFHFNFWELPSSITLDKAWFLKSGSPLDRYNIYNSSNAPFKDTSPAVRGARLVTTAELTDINNTYNIKDKFVGSEVYNTTTSTFMKAVGAAPSSPWINLNGTTGIQPV